MKKLAGFTLWDAPGAPSSQQHMRAACMHGSARWLIPIARNRWSSLGRLIIHGGVVVFSLWADYKLPSPSYRNGQIRTSSSTISTTAGWIERRPAMNCFWYMWRVSRSCWLPLVNSKLAEARIMHGMACRFGCPPPRAGHGCFIGWPYARPPRLKEAYLLFRQDVACMCACRCDVRRRRST
jgi:hypothetical protein